MLHLVLYQPEIPHNTGACGRLALATGSRLHLICPLGFSLEDKHLKRAGLDYWQEVDVRVWADWQAFWEGSGVHRDRIWFFSTKGQGCHWEADLGGEETWLVMGPETRGLPDSLLAEYADRVLRIPMLGTRSLNLATSAAVALYEAVRQRAQRGVPEGLGP